MVDARRLLSDIHSFVLIFALNLLAKQGLEGSSEHNWRELLSRTSPELDFNRRDHKTSKQCPPGGFLRLL